MIGLNKVDLLINEQIVFFSDITFNPKFNYFLISV